jgi:hypothetical protein
VPTYSNDARTSYTTAAVLLHMPGIGACIARVNLRASAPVHLTLEALSGTFTIRWRRRYVRILFVRIVVFIVTIADHS